MDLPEHNLKKRLLFTAMLVFHVFAFLACWSYSWADWPSERLAPAIWPVENMCGPAGAWLSYYLLSFFGYSVFVLLFFGAAFALLRLLNRTVADLPLRAVGLVILVLATSAVGFLMAPTLDYPQDNPLPLSAGGAVGSALGKVVYAQLSHWGSALILSAAVLVGLLLAADTSVLFILRFLWSRLKVLLGKLPVLRKAVAKSAAAAIPRINPHRAQLAGPAGAGTTVSLDEHELAEYEEAAVPDEEDEELEEDEEEEEEEEEVDEEESAEELRVKFRGGKPGPKPKSKPGERAVARTEISEKKRKAMANYRLPPLDLLESAEYTMASMQEEAVREKAVVLENTLEEFNIEVKVVEIDTGPTITLFEIELSPGTKVSQIRSLANDLARALGVGSVRIVAPIPGKHTIGVEIPNCEKEMVRIRELIEMSRVKAARMKLPMFLAKDASGKPLVADLSSMPHMLIAGATGSGKSVCINTIVTSILMAQRPDHVKLILVDPKMVEMAQFQDVPHLMCPIINDLARAESVLEWAVTKMEERYEILREAGVRNIASYNRLSADEILNRFKPACDEEQAQIPMHLPYIVIIIDELADLIITASKEVENYIIRLAQKSRAVGIHLIVATQRPSVNVVTGLIKSNLPCRISFRVASRQESRIVLDHNGAETLLGKGDMLFLEPGTDQLTRAQGAMVEDKELSEIIDYLRKQAEPDFNAELTRLHATDADGQTARDPLFDKAVEMVISSQRASVSLLQRRLSVPFARAAKLIDLMSDAGIVGPDRGSQAREIQVTAAEWRGMQNQVARDAADGFRDLQEEEEEPVEAGERS